MISGMNLAAKNYMSTESKKCTIVDCDTKIFQRGLCQAHYKRVKEMGLLKTAEIHRLSDKNSIYETAICSICGPVCIVRERNYWRCKYAKDASDQNTTQIKISVLRESQKGSSCEICGSKANLYWDHCHKEDLYRGTLCLTCNVGLGAFKDDPKLLQRSIDYLASASNKFEDWKANKSQAELKQWRSNPFSVGEDWSHLGPIPIRTRTRYN